MASKGSTFKRVFIVVAVLAAVAVGYQALFAQGSSCTGVPLNDAQGMLACTKADADRTFPDLWEEIQAVLSK